MCTVSFLPLKDRIFITSNRDEKVWRLPAHAPAIYEMKTCDMAFPKDGDAGGTWITVCSNGNAGVLLNGAFEKHERKESYRKSRGLVFLDLMDNQRPLHAFINQSLKGIEPFTLILWQKGNLYECRWDEWEKRFVRALKNYRPHIWSSATLYDEAVRNKREQWFLKWLNDHPAPTRREILRFHHFAGDGNRDNDLMMNRNGTVFTLSITSIEINEDGGSLSYTDVKTHETTYQEVHFSGNLILV
jgi:hypothetical protein